MQEKGDGSCSGFSFHGLFFANEQLLEYLLHTNRVFACILIPIVNPSTHNYKSIQWIYNFQLGDIENTSSIPKAQIITMHLSKLKQTFLIIDERP